MKETKNIKLVEIPAYARDLGVGCFAADVRYMYQCKRCGVRSTGTTSSGDTPGWFPGNGYQGKCPDTNSGQHVWELIILSRS